ncbi:MAG: tRNA (N(6)-L-threonylcarbamoyladenosine(37)-C(2))-methylthiotransferase MtaB [Chloroflexota bacterium]
MPSVAFHTLGCKVNQYDTEAMIESFRASGYDIVDFNDEADVYVINTCTVTGRGSQKSRQTVRQARRRNARAIVAITGCYPQVSPEEAAAIPGVDIVAGTKDRKGIVDLVERAISQREQAGAAATDSDAGAADPPAQIRAIGDIMQTREFEDIPITEFTSRTRATVKVQEGCNQYCSYCIIPYARGPMRSRPPASVQAEVERLAAAGFKEVVLTGIHLGAYGAGLTERTSLAALLRLLAPVPGLERIRISSIEPLEVTDELLQTMVANPKVCHHLHIPLQSGDADVLSRMNRHYTPEQYQEVVARARAAMPDIAITTDVIVGFPGETEANFLNTYALAGAVEFAKMHIFQYSRRAGTPAADMPDQVSDRLKEERAHRLAALDESLVLAFEQRFIGKTLPVLVEEEAGGGRAGTLEGLTGNYMRVVFRGAEELKNTVQKIRLREARGEIVIGDLARS